MAVERARPGRAPELRKPAQHFSEGCRDCPRLAAHLDKIRASHPGYHARPVAPFGDPHPRLLIVGLAPGLHGANRTGRPFTGDDAGILLYEALYRFGLANRPNASSLADGMQLYGCRITNAVKCLPPENKPRADEVRRCNRYLCAELSALPRKAAILALGRIAHFAVLRAFALSTGSYRFSHGARYDLPGQRTLYDSYHCSRYNTQTKRLTRAMFHDVVSAISKDLAALPHS